MVLVALANPVLFLPVFLLGSGVVYVIASFIFLQKGIDNHQPCKHRLKDWIRVNAFVSIAFCVLMLFNCVTFLSNPNSFAEMMHQAISQQPMMTLPEATYIKMMKGVLYFFLGYALILLAHIFLTFRLLKAYAGMFKEKG